MPDSSKPTTPASALLITAVDRAERLGWRTITVRRMRRLQRGDESALPPDPATAPPSAFGQSQWGADCRRREQPHKYPPEAQR